MKRLRRSLSLRSSQRRIPESCRPQVWENDSYKVRNGGVNFPVKYVGCIEVTESRGTQVCAEAFRRLKENSSGKKKRMTLLVTADCIRLVDDETKSLVVDQTIEKVSFCTPDPSNDRVFSYICRDGTTRRWMCHCFLAVRDTGERLSHAVGCAFTACLQRKQKAQALQQQHQAQKQKESETGSGKTQVETSVASVTNGPTTTQAQAQPLTQAQLAAQAQLTTQAKSPAPVQPAVTTAVPSSPAIAVTASPAVNTTPPPQQPVTTSPSKPGAPATQPVLKPPPSTARPRPQPFNPSPFTRHMSLRYRSNPLSFMPLKDGAGYETLTEETLSPVPKLPPTVDALVPNTSNTTATATHAAGFDPTPGPQRPQVQQPALTVMQPTPAYNAFGTTQSSQVSHPSTQNVSNSWQPFGAPLQPIVAQGNAWGSGNRQPLTRKVSDAENWLATVQADTSKSVANGTGSNQGLLTTTNPFGETATQLDALSNAWTKDLTNQLPSVSPKAGATATGPSIQTSPWPSQPSQGDGFSSLGTRSTSGPSGNNPFGQTKQVFWV